MKKHSKVLICILSVILVLLSGIGIGAKILLIPTLTIDFSQQSELSGRASGFLYGLAEDDIPTADITESIGINTLATKPAGGLQHPIGDVNNIYQTFTDAGGEILLIYTQDMYDTWYYEFDSLELYNEKVLKTVTEMENSEYKDKLAYCIYNEMDNGVWFGDHWQQENRFKFYDAWKSTYTLVKSINPDAKIAGPGHAGYNKEFIQEFLTYCKDNECLPEIVVWHELSDQSIYWMETHFEEYYTMCDEIGIERLPVCISEYGLMKTNGIPGESVKWISRLEAEDAYGCVAYWRLANNLADTVADDVTPNSNYWVYKFYAEMKGKELAVEELDLLHSNLGNYLKGKYPLFNKGFIGCASFDKNEKKFYIMTGGSKTDSNIKIENIDEKYFANGDKVTVKVSYVDYKGLGGAVYSPEEYFTDIVKVSGNAIKFTLPCERESQAYFIEITPYDNEEKYENDQTFDRFEAEDAIINGSAVATDEIAYSSSENKVVKKLDKNSSIEFKIKVDEDGIYNIDFLYGNGPFNEQRSKAEIAVNVNDDESTVIMLPSTIKEDYIECFSAQFNLKKGTNHLKLSVQNDAVLTLDCIDVTLSSNLKNTYFFQIKSRTADTSENAYAIIVKNDGYYEIKTSGEAFVKYFHRGYNKLVVDNNVTVQNVSSAENGNEVFTITPSDMQLFNGATLEDDSNTLSGKRIGWISSDTGSYCTFNLNVSESGYYNFTIEYANNEEGGAHAYNVDLIERYISLSVNGEKQGNYFFRSTYAWDNYKTKTICIYLNEGENEIKVSNDGSYSFNDRVTYAPNIGNITINK